MTRALQKEQFSRDRDFVTCHPMECAGVEIPPGQPVNKDLFTTRRLKQLFEQRRITFASDADRPPEQPKIVTMGDPDVTIEHFVHDDPPAPEPQPSSEASAEEVPTGRLRRRKLTRQKEE
jgi:hypothetical protein